MLDRRNERRESCPIPALRGNASSFSPLSMMIVVGVFIDVPYQVEEIPIYPSYAESWFCFCLFFFLIMNRRWILSSVFSVSIDFYFSFLMCGIMLVDLQMLNVPCTLGISSSLSPLILHSIPVS